MLDDLLALAHGRIQASLRHAGVGLDRFRHRGGRHAADLCGLGLRARAARSAIPASPSIEFRSGPPNSASTGTSRGARCACRSRLRPAPPATPCAPSLRHRAQPGGNWMFALGGGWVVLDPLTPEDEGLVLKRVAMRGQHRSRPRSASRSNMATSAPRSWAAAVTRASPSRCPARSITATNRGLRWASPVIRCRPRAFKRLWP